MMSGSLQRTNISGCPPGIPTGAPAEERDQDEAVFSIFSVLATLHPTQPQTLTLGYEQTTQAYWCRKLTTK